MAKISKSKKRIYGFLAIAFALWLLVACWAVISQRQGSGVDPIYPNVHVNAYSDNQNFRVYEGEARLYDVAISGAMLPRPEQNVNALAETMDVLSKNSLHDVVVVLCFDDNVGPSVVSGDWAWQTSYGVTQVHSAVLEDMIWGGVTVDNERLGKSKDVGLMMSYCGFYLPGRYVVPLLMDVTMTETDIRLALDWVLPREDCTVLVMPPAGYDERLSVEDIRELGSLLDNGGERDLAGIIGSGNSRALSVLHASLSSSDEMVSIRYGDSNSASGRRFSDLLIFYGERS